MRVIILAALLTVVTGFTTTRKFTTLKYSFHAVEIGQRGLRCQRSMWLVSSVIPALVLTLLPEIRGIFTRRFAGWEG